MGSQLLPVIAAQAGIQGCKAERRPGTPAFAGATTER